jgi:hypothetical protein
VRDLARKLGVEVPICEAVAAEVDWPARRRVGVGSIG